MWGSDRCRLDSNDALNLTLFGSQHDAGMWLPELIKNKVFLNTAPFLRLLIRLLDFGKARIW